MTHLRKKHHPQSVVAYYCACFTNCSCTCNCWCECNSPEEFAGQWNIAGQAIYDNRYSTDYDNAQASRDQEHVLNPA